MAVFALLLLMSGGATAQAQVGQWAKAGIWTTSGNPSGDDPTCSVAGEGNSGTFLVVAEANIPGAIKLAFVPRNPDLARGTQATVVMTFPDGVTQRITGDSAGSMINIFLVNGDLAPWLHEFTARKSMTVTIDGALDEPATFNLAGTTPTINAMNDCTIAAGFRLLPAPFVAAPPAMTAPPLTRAAPQSEQAQIAPSDAPATPPSSTPSPGQIQQSSPSSNQNDESGAGAVIIAIIIGAFVLYFLPAIVGIRRGLSSSGALLFVNMFFGWTVIGWLFCILWAATGATRAQDAYFTKAARRVSNTAQDPMDDPAFREAYARERARLDHLNKK